MDILTCEDNVLSFSFLMLCNSGKKKIHASYSVSFFFKGNLTKFSLQANSITGTKTSQRTKVYSDKVITESMYCGEKLIKPLTRKIVALNPE